MPRRSLALMLLAVLATAGIGISRASTGLAVGAGVRSITPPPEMFDEVWSIEGGEHPTIVLDPIEARAISIRVGDQRLVMVSLDLLGLFYEDVSTIRDLVRAGVGDDTQVIVASTHSHSSIDTIGLWGPDQFTTGVNADYQRMVITEAAAAAIAAVHAERSATMHVAQAPAPAGYNEFDRNRHPGSFDDTVNVLSFRDADAVTIGTLVNWASHPELVDPGNGSDPAIGAGNVAISSDYVHTLRQTVEAQVGGTAVFVNGAIGAVTALAMPIEDPETGEVFPRRSVAKATHVGAVIGQTAVDALDGAVEIADPALAIAGTEFDLPVDNPFLVAIRAIGTLQRQFYLAGQPVPLGTDVRTQMLRVQLGPVEFLTSPGEMQPDLYTGGYLPKAEMANPDVPPEQPIRGQMTGAVRFIVGLAQDELGYFVSATDYVRPTFYPVYGEGEDRNGIEHYQETLAIGRDTARRLSQIASMLLGTSPEADYEAYVGGVLDPWGHPMYGIPHGDIAGIWLDTSDSGRYEAGEDVAAMLKTTVGPDAARGFLDSQGRDIGPDASAAARGVWVDANGSGAFERDRDLWLLLDSYAFGEGEPAP